MIEEIGVDIETILKNAQGGEAISNLAKAFGMEPAQAEPAVHALLSALAKRVERNTLSRGGLADMVALLGTPEAGRALADPHSLATPMMAQAGNEILNTLIGNKHISRGIAAKAAAETGLSEDTLKKMLPVVASMMIGSAQSSTQAIFSERLRDVPGLGGLASGARGGSPLPLPGEAPSANPNGTGGWGVELPRPSGGAGGGMGGTVGGGSPLPIPGDTIPGVGRPNRYDDLGEVIRKGGTPAPGGGGSLENMIRSIIGNLFGFKNRGVIGNLIQVMLARWLMNVVRRLLSRMFGAR